MVSVSGGESKFMSSSTKTTITRRARELAKRKPTMLARQNGSSFWQGSVGRSSLDEDALLVFQLKRGAATDKLPSGGLVEEISTLGIILLLLLLALISVSYYG